MTDDLLAPSFFLSLFSFLYAHKYYECDLFPKSTYNTVFVVVKQKGKKKNCSASKTAIVLKLILDRDP